MTKVGRLKDGNLMLRGEINERLPVVVDGLIIHLPFDGVMKSIDGIKEPSENVGNSVSDKGVKVEGNLSYEFFPVGDFTFACDLQPNYMWEDKTTSNLSAQPKVENIFVWGIPGSNGFLLKADRNMSSLILELYPTSNLNYDYTNDIQINNRKEIKICISFSNSNKEIYFYINGKQIGQSIINKPTNGVLRFYREGFSSRFGTYSNLSLYNRVLNENEIESLFLTKMSFTQSGNMIVKEIIEDPLLDVEMRTKNNSTTLKGSITENSTIG